MFVIVNVTVSMLQVIINVYFISDILVLFLLLFITNETIIYNLTIFIFTYKVSIWAFRKHNTYYKIYLILSNKILFIINNNANSTGLNILTNWIFLQEHS